MRRNPWKRYAGRAVVTVRVPGSVEHTYRGRLVGEVGGYLVLADALIEGAGDKGTDVLLKGEQWLRRETIVSMQRPDA